MKLTIFYSGLCKQIEAVNDARTPDRLCRQIDAINTFFPKANTEDEKKPVTNTVVNIVKRF